MGLDMLRAMSSSLLAVAICVASLVLSTAI
jgi:hypothetical protein